MLHLLMSYVHLAVFVAIILWDITCFQMYEPIQRPLLTFKFHQLHLSGLFIVCSIATK